MNTCFIYCRKSSEDKDRQILSLNDQENICTELAQDKGFSILGIYKESKSAKRPDKRPEFKEMISRIAQGEAKYVICWKADRLCRNAKEGGTLIDKVDYENLNIITPSMDYDRGNSTFLFIEFGMATKFSKDLSDNVKRGLNTKVQNGWRPGSAPLGYLNDYSRPKGDKQILVDQERFALCRKWWELMLSGNETVEGSLEKISAMGLRSKRTGKSVSRTEAFRFFRNIFYAGFFDYKNERYEGKHQSMITLNEYYRVQEIIDGRASVHRETNDYYFMKTLECGECGSAITCDRKTKKYKNGKTQEFVYARCVKKKGPCSQKYLNANDLKKQIDDFIESLEISPSFIVWVRKNLKRRNAKEFDFERAQKTKLTKRLDALLAEKKQLYGMKIEGLIGEDEYKKEKDRLLKEEHQTKEQISKDNLGAWTKTMEEILAFASNITKIFYKGDTETKRMVLRILGSNLILKDKIVRIDAKKAFLYLKKTENKVNQKKQWLEPENTPIDRSKRAFLQMQSDLERVMGIEPTYSAWKADALPLSYTREHSIYVYVLLINHHSITNQEFDYTKKERQVKS